MVVANTLIVVVTIYREFDMRRDVQDSAITSLERMTKEIRNAQSVSTSGSAFNTNPSTLVVSALDGSTPVVREFAIVDGVLRLYEDGVDQGPLSSTDVEITNFVVRFSDTEHSELVKIEMTIQGSDGEYQRNFYNSTILRGSYND